MTFVLVRADKSRGGQWDPDDYDVHDLTLLGPVIPRRGLCILRVFKFQRFQHFSVSFEEVVRFFQCCLQIPKRELLLRFSDLVHC